MKRWWPKIRVGMLLLPALFLTGATSVSDQSMIESVRAVYGERAALRTTAWRELMAQGKRENWSEQRKLTEVNRFFNRLTFIADTLLWRMNDYWASPLEFLGAGGGLSLDQILIPCAIRSLAARKPSSLLCRASQPSQRAPQLAIPVRLLSIKPPSLAIAM